MPSQSNICIFYGERVWQDSHVWRNSGTSGIYISMNEALYWTERHAVDHVFESHAPGVSSGPDNQRRGRPYAVLGSPIRVTSDHIPPAGLASIRRGLAAIGWRITGMSAIESLDLAPGGGTRTVMSRHGVRYIVRRIRGREAAN